MGAVLLASLLFPHVGARAFARILRSLTGLARRPRLAIVSCAAAAFVGSALVAWLVYWPDPKTHDDFNHLLSAETYLRGRLANPTHPLWHHFETFHILHVPTYMSKFPPGPGLVMALGWALAGHPLVGVWLGGAFLGAAITWMLYGWLPQRWALLGGLMAVAQYGVATYWTQTYWGGALAAGGGALVYGALPRILVGGGLRDGVLLGAGLAVLAVTRPFEGSVIALPAVALLVAWLWRSRGFPDRAGLRAVLGAGVLVVAALGWLAWNNAAVTGDPLKLPYQAHDEQYAAAPPFLCSPRPERPEYRHAVMESFWTGWAAEPWENQRDLAGVLQHVPDKFGRLWWFYLGPLPSFLLLALPWALRQRGRLFVLSTCGLLCAALLVEPHCLQHYPAPATGLLVLLVMSSARVVAAWRWSGRRIGQGPLCAVLIGTLALTVAQACTRGSPEDSWYGQRAAIQRRLEAEGGRHLVIVRYGPEHSVHDEWVFNGADIDRATVVWARDMGVEANQPLLEHFEDRTVWLLTAGGPTSPARFELHPSQELALLVAPGARPEKLAGDMLFVEGPVWTDADGGTLVLSDIEADRLMRWSPIDGLSVLREPCAAPNGNARDAEGRLITCEQRAGRLIRTEPDGALTVLVDRYRGRRLGGPNDLALRSDGTIWFTDPGYWMGERPREIESNNVFRFDPRTDELRVAAADFDRPNGLCFSPDGTRLYVSDSGQPQHIRVFDVQPDGSLTGGGVFYRDDELRDPDGMRCDEEGRLLCAAASGVYVIGPDGHLIGRIPLPEPARNLCIGGPQGRTLFMTAGTSLYAVELRSD